MFFFFICLLSGFQFLGAGLLNLFFNKKIYDFITINRLFWLKIRFGEAAAAKYVNTWIEPYNFRVYSLLIIMMGGLFLSIAYFLGVELWGAVP